MAAVGVGGAHALGLDLLGREAVAAHVVADGACAAFAQPAVIVGASPRVGIGAYLYIIARVCGLSGEVAERGVLVDVSIVGAEEIDHACRGVVDTVDGAVFQNVRRLFRRCREAVCRVILGVHHGVECRSAAFEQLVAGNGTLGHGHVPVDR